MHYAECGCVQLGGDLVYAVCPSVEAHGIETMTNVIYLVLYATRISCLETVWWL
jgi:hypothetical protein